MKITQQFCLEEDNYFFLLDEMRYLRRKNLSRTLNELLINYRNMMKALEKKQKEIQQQEKEKEEYKEQAKAYSDQLKKARVENK